VAEDVLRDIAALGRPAARRAVHFDRKWMERQGERVMNLRARALLADRALNALPAGGAGAYRGG